MRCSKNVQKMFTVHTFFTFVFYTCKSNNFVTCLKILFFRICVSFIKGKSILKLSETEQVIFRQYVQEVLLEEKVWQLDKYIQHGQTTRLEHSLAVTYFSYWLHCRLNLAGDARSLIRGAMLHDFFLYDLRDERPAFHGKTHPYYSCKNASECFMLNEEERDIILNHMFPLTTSLPVYKSALVVSFVDKFCASAEFLHLSYNACLSALGDQTRIRQTQSKFSRAKNVLVLAAEMRQN